MTRYSVAALLLFAACGGIAVIDADSTSSSSSSSSSANSSSSGPGGCSSHDDCPGTSVCLFGTGECARACPDICEPCAPGSVCDGCATASCPGCADCVAACLPAQPGRCDDHDDCPSGQICLYGVGECVPQCNDDGDCPGAACLDCATSSCPCCDDCRSACVLTP